MRAAKALTYMEDTSLTPAPRAEQGREDETGSTELEIKFSRPMKEHSGPSILHERLLPQSLRPNQCLQLPLDQNLTLDQSSRLLDLAVYSLVTHQSGNIVNIPYGSENIGGDSPSTPNKSAKNDDRK